MQSQSSAAINQLCDEKGIPATKVPGHGESRPSEPHTARIARVKQNIEIEISDKTEAIQVVLIKEVVKKVEEPIPS